MNYKGCALSDKASCSGKQKLEFGRHPGQAARDPGSILGQTSMGPGSKLRFVRDDETT